MAVGGKRTALLLGTLTAFLSPSLDRRRAWRLLEQKWERHVLLGIAEIFPSYFVEF